MEELIKKFKTLKREDKIAFMKKVMPYMMEIFENDPAEMMSDMMPFCMSMMKSKGMDMERMRGMMKGMMAEPLRKADR